MATNTFQISSPILRDVRFAYPDTVGVPAHALTSTSFHTYYQGGEMVVAGRSARELVEYEIVATQASGREYAVEGAYNGSEVSLTARAPGGGIESTVNRLQFF